MHSFLFLDLSVVEMYQLGIYKNGEHTNPMSTSLPCIVARIPFADRIIHHTEVFQARKDDGNTKNETAWKLYFTFVRIEKFKVFHLWQRFDIHTRIPINNQRFEILESPEEIKISYIVHRQIQMCYVKSQNFDDMCWKISHAFVGKWDSSVSDFIDEHVSSPGNNRNISGICDSMRINLEFRALTHRNFPAHCRCNSQSFFDAECSTLCKVVHENFSPSDSFEFKKKFRWNFDNFDSMNWTHQTDFSNACFVFSLISESLSLSQSEILETLLLLFSSIATLLTWTRINFNFHTHS